MTLRIILVIIVAGLILYGFFSYVDTIIEAKHDEMTREYQCNMGLDDEQIKEIQKEDE